MANTEEGDVVEQPLSKEVLRDAADQVRKELEGAILNIPEAREQAAGAYIKGDSVSGITFSVGGKDVHYKTEHSNLRLQIGEPGAFKFGSKGHIETTIDIGNGWIGPDSIARIQFQDDQTYKENSGFRVPIGNTEQTVEKVREVINTLRQNN
ncbi:MAG: hypothetical protein Q7R49_02705 [Candidatus Daviesbacteria bacterium]|nr:hypothetical protein [Candidatus Daviesbacteria bacterium]